MRLYSRNVPITRTNDRSPPITPPTIALVGDVCEDGAIAAAGETLGVGLNDICKPGLGAGVEAEATV